MPRTRSEKRQQAFEIWRDSKGEAKLKDIAAQLGVIDTQIRKWKNQDRWEEQLNGNVTKKKGNVTKSKRGPGAPYGNQNAKGHGGPPGNDKAKKHGFFEMIFPDDPDTLAIVEEINAKRQSRLDILWENIVIQYTAISRAQKIMNVTDRDEMIKELKRSYVKESERTTKQTSSNSQECEYEYEFQFAWDRQATFMNAQSRAIKTLEGLISRYEKLLLTDLQTEEQELRVVKLKTEVKIMEEQLQLKRETEQEKLQLAREKLALDRAKSIGDSGDLEDDGFMEALQGQVSEIWGDDDAET